MDDEIARQGIKEELTTREYYLENRFTKLSSSGHDLTPLTPAEIDEFKVKLVRQTQTQTAEDGEEGSFLGAGQKGLYVCSIGGLPLFASGFRVDKDCNTNTLVFTEPCDEEHIRTWQSGQDTFFDCVRSGITVGKKINGKFAVNSKTVSFLPLNRPFPVESQPENYWGTEGQFRQWERRE